MDFLVSLGLQEEHEVDPQPKEQNNEFNQVDRIILNPGVHLKPPNDPKIRPHLKKGEPDLRKQDQLINQGRKFLEDN
jgi:hypothetical protein